MFKIKNLLQNSNLFTHFKKSIILCSFMLFSKCRCLSSTSDPSAWYNRVQLNTFNQQKEINRLINESKGFSIQIKKLIQRIECLEKKVKQLEQKAQQQPRGNRGLTYIVQESAPVKADIATIKEKLKQAMEEGQRGQNKFSAIDANFDILVQAGDKLYQGLEKKIKELEDQLARKQKEDLDKLKKEIDQELKQEVDEKLKKKSNQIQKQASEIQHLQDVKGVLEREISNLKHAVAQNTEIKELEQQFKQIKKSQRQQLDATRAGVTTELENKLTTINQTVESKNLEYEKNLSDELKALRTELEEKIDQEAKERKLLQVTVDKTKKQVDDFDQKFIQAYNKQFQEIENLFEQKVDNDAKIKQLEGNINKIEEFQRELTTITGAVDASKDTTAQLAQIQQEVGEIKHLNDTSSKIVNEKVQQTVEKGTDAKIKVESEERSGEIKEKLDKSFEEIKRIQQKVDQINPLLDGKIIDKLGDLKNEIDTIKKQNNEITSLLKLNEKVNKIEEFQQQLTTITGAVDAIKEDTTAKLTNIQEKIDKSQKEVRKIQQEVEKIKNLNDTSSKTVSTKVQQTVDQEIPEYKNQLNKINELPSKLDQQINNINQLKGQYNDLKEEIDKIQKLISDIKEKELEQRVNQLENAIKDIANQKIEEIVNKIEADETQKLRNDL